MGGRLASGIHERFHAAGNRSNSCCLLGRFFSGWGQTTFLIKWGDVVRNAILCGGVLLALLCSTANADIVLYRIPGTGLAFKLQGKVSTNPGGTVTFRHPRYGTLYLALKDITKYELPSTKALANEKIRKAIKSQDVEQCIEAARWSLHNGLIDRFFEAASAAWKIDKNHRTVQRLAAMNRKIRTKLPESKERENEMLKFVRGSSGMKFQRSDHFLLLHDTSGITDRRTKKTRADERLDLLEAVYKSFLLKFCLEGYDLDVPKERLKVVLFADKDDYLRFVDLLGPDLSKASGFYHRKENISVFYDSGTNELFDALYALNKKLQATTKRMKRDRAPGTREIVRFAGTIQLLTEVSRENSDIEVVSHEATHHMAGNTGLMPGDAPVPVWAAEGLATYFESPKDAAWSGIGAVNEERLDWYRELARDTTHSNIDFIVSDQVFSRAATHGAALHGYGQAWALTHFLMAKHFDKLIEWYKLIAQMPKDKPLSGKELIESFDKVFGKNRAALDREWRRYMNSLKTDFERVLEEQG